MASVERELCLELCSHRDVIDVNFMYVCIVKKSDFCQVHYSDDSVFV